MNSKLEYLNSLYCNEEKIFESIDKSIEESGLRAINIDKFEGKILKLLIQLSNAKKIIEVGTLAGYSTMWLASALGDNNGLVYSFEAEKKAFDVAIKNINLSKYKNKIKLIYGHAHTELINISNEAPFDAIFIDAEKRGYVKYLDWAEANIKKGGLIIADNTFLNDAVFDERKITEKNKKQTATMKDFNSRLADKSKYESVILPTDEGLSVAIKKF